MTTESHRYEPRSITDDEVPAFRSAVAIGFGGDRKPEGDEVFRSLMPIERTVAVFDGDEIVGTLGDFELQLAVPGGAYVTMAGTTMVTVRATHTRRGILRSMIRKHLDLAVERNEPVAGLWASEAAIYGRFGFGLASENHVVRIDNRRLDRPPVAPDLEVAVLQAEDIPTVVAPFWTSAGAAISGFIDRGAARWKAIMDDPEYAREGASGLRHVVVRRNGEVVGYMDYRQRRKWDDFVAAGTIDIGTLVAADLDARLALWNHALDVDLFPNVEFWNGAVDDPLATVASDPRAVQRSIGDALYVRILDVPAALQARTYEVDDELVLGITDDLGYAEGTYRIVVTNGAAEVTPTADDADVTMRARELGALYLGRACASLLDTTGRLDGRPDAVGRLGRLFATAEAPWCPEMF